MTELSLKKYIMVTNLDNSTISFPQDERISFQEEGHIYLLDGTSPPSARFTIDTLCPLIAITGLHAKP